MMKNTVKVTVTIKITIKFVKLNSIADTLTIKYIC